MPLTPEEVLAQLRVRNFEKGFQRTPLQEFTGKLDAIGGEMIDRFQPPRMEVVLGFSDVNVMRSTEPYPFPVAQITILHSNREKSGWGVFGVSVDKIVNADLPVDAPPEQIRNIDALIGKVIHMNMTGGHMMWDRDRGEETPRECWEVIAIIEGEIPAAAQPTATATPAPKAKAESSTNKALELLDGKTEQEWYTIVFQNPVVKADSALINSIIQRTFLPPLEEAGIVSKDADGKYTVTKEG